jgi:transposase
VDNDTLFPRSGSPVKEKKEQSKPRLRKIDRRQMVLHPVEIERLIPEDHEARAIWEIIGSLDLSCYYDQVDAREGQAGAPAFDPRLLVSLWVYSYSKGIGSSREIARLSQYDPAYQWLTGMRPVNYHTLADFRSAYGESIRNLFVQVLGILSYEGLITMERVMHDGTKIKASAGDSTFRREKTLKDHLARAEAQVKAVEEPEGEMTPRISKARERAARERKERLSRAIDELEKVAAKKKNTEKRVSTTDPESRTMSLGGNLCPCYNLQLSTDAHEKAIVGVSLSASPNDHNLIEPALTTLEKITGRLPDQMVVDGGFTTRGDILAAKEKGVDFIGSMPDASASKGIQLRARGITEEFAPEKFLFNPERNCLICPEGKPVPYRQKRKAKGKTIYHYQCKEYTCPSKPVCCPQSKSGRHICRLENDPEITSFLLKMETPEAKAIYKTRSEVAEFPNAWIKDKFRLRQFHLRGLIKAETEAFWACLTYNIKLWIRLCWRPTLAV